MCVACMRKLNVNKKLLLVGLRDYFAEAAASYCEFINVGFVDVLYHKFYVLVHVSLIESLIKKYMYNLSTSTTLDIKFSRSQD